MIKNAQLWFPPLLLDCLDLAQREHSSTLQRCHHWRFPDQSSEHQAMCTDSSWQVQHANHTGAAGNAAISLLAPPAHTMNMLHAQCSTSRVSWRGHAWEVMNGGQALQQMLLRGQLPPKCI